MKDKEKEICSCHLKDELLWIPEMLLSYLSMTQSHGYVRRTSWFVISPLPNERSCKHKIDSFLCNLPFHLWLSLNVQLAEVVYYSQFIHAACSEKACILQNLGLFIFNVKWVAMSNNIHSSKSASLLFVV